jgi:hypothetical protein
MVLCKNDLHALLVALDLSRRTMTRIHANYFWALAYNACLIPVAAGVLYPAYRFALAPMLAGAAMALSSVSIVLSSLLLMRYQPPRSFEAPSMHASGEAAEGECNCPASSAQELDVEEASAFAQAWTALLGGGSESSAVVMEGLLTPAEWRASVVEGHQDDSGWRGGELLEPSVDSKAIWNPLTALKGGGGKVLRGRREGGGFLSVCTTHYQHELPVNETTQTKHTSSQNPSKEHCALQLLLRRSIHQEVTLLRQNRVAVDLGPGALVGGFTSIIYFELKRRIVTNSLRGLRGAE